MKHQKQQGMALLTVLLLVVAITIIAGSMLASQQRMLRQYEVVKNQNQRREYALGAETFASQILQQDSKQNQTDSLHDIWAKPLPNQPIAQGQISSKIVDNASLFNLNNLYQNGQVNQAAVDFFKRLLISQGLDPNIAHAVLDWQDIDHEAMKDGGAEQDYYQSLGKPLPMPIANQPFISVDELVYVRGMDAQKLTKIRHLLTAVPYFLPMNVNTMQPELLMAIAPEYLAPSQLAAWANQRETALPIASLQDFWAMPVFGKVAEEQKQAINGLLDVQSRTFRLFVVVNMNEKASYFTSLLAKQDDKVVGFYRQFLPYKPVDWQ